MTLGSFLFVAGLILPRLFSPDTPHGILVTAGVMVLAAIPFFVTGSCIYARGIGYPFWLGIFSVTIIGLLILMLLPDRVPEAKDAEL